MPCGGQGLHGLLDQAMNLPFEQGEPQKMTKQRRVLLNCKWVLEAHFLCVEGNALPGKLELWSQGGLGRGSYGFSGKDQ